MGRAGLEPAASGLSIWRRELPLVVTVGESAYLSDFRGAAFPVHRYWLPKLLSPCFPPRRFLAGARELETRANGDATAKQNRLTFQS